MNNIIYGIINIPKIIKYAIMLANRKFDELEKECLSDNNDLINISFLIDIYLYANRVEDEIECLIKYLNKRRNLKRLQRLCFLLFDRKMYDKAIEIIEAQISRVPKKKYVEYLRYLITAYKETSNFEKCLELLEIMEEMNPNENRLHEKKEYALQKLKNRGQLS